MDFLQSRVDEFCHVKNFAKELFVKNTNLAITSRPFKGLEGILQKETGGERVVLLLNFLQKQHAVKVPLVAIEVA